MITIEEFEIAAKDLAKAFKRLDSVTFATDADPDENLSRLHVGMMPNV
ncbi:hypothetical protein [Caudoviricetes sp.]|nr:hypothetical protein [Caudoviricetes sp.]